MITAPSLELLSTGLTDEEWRLAQGAFQAADVDRVYVVPKKALLGLCRLEEPTVLHLPHTALLYLCPSCPLAVPCPVAHLCGVWPV